MTENKLVYAAVQNGCILDVFESEDEAINRVNEEIKRDWVSIILKRSLRRMLSKHGNIALHDYSVLKIVEVKKING